MFYQEYLPHPSLRKHIKCYWTLSISEALKTDRGTRFLAEGLELSFNLGDPIEVVTHTSGSLVARRSFMSGPMTQPMRMRPTGRVELLGVCFRAGGSYAFFPYPAGELVDGRGEIEDFWGSRGAAIIGRIQDECRCIGERIALLDRHFLQLLDKSPKNDSYVATALHEIEAREGQLQIRHLARSVGLSSRQLERRFKEQVGISPKQLSRSLRFKNLFKVIVKSSPDSWASTAFTCGYSDQSHMIRDFKHYTGSSPTSYFARQAETDALFFGNF